MGVTRAGGRPRFASETDPVRQLMFEDFSGGTCLGDIMLLMWKKLPYCEVWLITLPCVNFAQSGNRTGRHGLTGHLYVAVVQPLLVKKPRVFVHEISDYADKVNNGEGVQMVIDALSPESLFGL